MTVPHLETRSTPVLRLLLPLLVLQVLAAQAVEVTAQTTAGQKTATQQKVESAEQDTIDLSIAEVPLFSARLLSELYAELGHRDLWDEGRARQMLDLARQSRWHGFNQNDFHADDIERVISEGQLKGEASDRRFAADILLSDALLRYVHHLRFGKYNPRRINHGSAYVEKADAESLEADMRLLLAAPDMAEKLDTLLPHPPFYENLRRGYRRYLAIAESGGWDDIPAGPNLRVGVSDPRVPAIRERLAVSDGFEDAAATDVDVYDEGLAEVVKNFQTRAGLSADGVIGPNTIRALNWPIEDVLVKIRANLERMRWLYNDLPADYLFVDLAAFRLQLMRDHEEVWSTKIIIGTKEDQTPMFRDEIEYLVFNPTWTMPPSIQKKTRSVGKKYRVYDRRTGQRVSASNVGNYRRYRVVQAPGPRNALGRIKFMFPNGHAIYLHDTPSKHLFSRSRRAYSHGCIRVQAPLTMARYVLDQPGWDESAITRAVARGRTRHVNLDKHLPVLLYYLTAIADDQGRVAVRADLYNRDEPLIAMLDQPAHGDRIAFPKPKPEPDPVSDPSDQEVVEQSLIVSASEPEPEKNQGQKSPVSSGAPDTQPNSVPAVEMPQSDVGPVFRRLRDGNQGDTEDGIGETDVRTLAQTSSGMETDVGRAADEAPASQTASMDESEAASR
ncbi:MAG: L,D-transpeptidase family protein [Chromatiaceae bacterium]|nr:L,D-transpeptidase family protein [Chromatiaceae bacterium]